MIAKSIKIAGLVIATASSVACSNWGGSAPLSESGGMQERADIVAIAAADDRFDTLVAAIEAAGLAATLQGPGPYTVFAPTDAAFAAVPADRLEALLADKQALTEVLTYHVVPGKVMAADVAKLDTAKTVQGQLIDIDTRSGVKVNDANVVTTDIVASNGVIHVIDRVILPR